jgi:6-pyruvoyltetrahydropterin/6-carboxytetrahydropterin synthase
LPDTHPCSRNHGHNYKVTIELRAKNLNDVGMIQDYRELSVIKDWIDKTLDHQCLNDVLPLNPTAENIAKFLFDQFKPGFPDLHSVTVSETNRTSATYWYNGTANY